MASCIKRLWLKVVQQLRKIPIPIQVVNENIENTSKKTLFSINEQKLTSKNFYRSPSDRTKIWSSELARHLQFDLVETSGMTEDQLREIPYTVVETHQSVKKPTTSSLKVNKTSKIQNGVDRIRK